MAVAKTGSAPSNAAKCVTDAGFEAPANLAVGAGSDDPSATKLGGVYPTSAAVTGSAKNPLRYPIAEEGSLRFGCPKRDLEVGLGNRPRRWLALVGVELSDESGAGGAQCGLDGLREHPVIEEYGLVRLAEAVIGRPVRTQVDEDFCVYVYVSLCDKPLNIEWDAACRDRL